MATDDQAVDAALARRIVAGDRSAESELCARLLPRIRAWGLKHTRDAAAASDIAQQVMMSVLEALRANRVVELDRLGAFTLGVCKHTLGAWRRGDHRRAGLLEIYGPALAGASTIAETALDRRRLAGCVEKLLPRARTLLALAYYADRSTDEIAGELGMTAGNVRVMRHRALQQLHACMEGS
jgi:RNA polymerase sigma-70 factor (ECF subfamily)